MTIIDRPAPEEAPLPQVYGVDEVSRPQPSGFDYMVGIPAIAVGMMFILVLVVFLVPVAIIRSLFGRLHEVLAERRVLAKVTSASPSIRRRSI